MLDGHSGIFTVGSDRGTLVLEGKDGHRSHLVEYDSGRLVWRFDWREMSYTATWTRVNDASGSWTHPEHSLEAQSPQVRPPDFPLVDIDSDSEDSVQLRLRARGIHETIGNARSTIPVSDLLESDFVPGPVGDMLRAASCALDRFNPQACAQLPELDCRPPDLDCSSTAPFILGATMVPRHGSSRPAAIRSRDWTGESCSALAVPCNTDTASEASEVSVNMAELFPDMFPDDFGEEQDDVDREVLQL